MATVGIKIFKHHEKADGTYNVKVRITHKGTNHYLDTSHFVTGRQLTSKFTIKDAFLNKLLNDTIEDYRETISKLDDRLELFTSESLRDYLKSKDEEINFLKFCSEYIEDLKIDGRKGSAGTLKTVMLSLEDYFKRNNVSPKEINHSMLMHYEKYLRKDRVLVRVNQFGTMHSRKVKGMGDAAIHNHMRDLRILFKAAMRHYNNPQINDVRIPHSPFDTYKIVDAPETKKRNLTIAQIESIRDSKVSPGSRAELAKELFMLSFYLCGTNAVDIYSLTKENIVHGRIEYKRSKTQGRRKDNAFISIKLLKDAKTILYKYLGKLQLRYTTSENLDHAINEGMKQVCIAAKLPPVTFYWARHSFGNLARNKCRLSKDDVALALNHIDNKHKTTDIYLEKDWKIIDDVQGAVLNLFEMKALNCRYNEPAVSHVKYLFDSIVLTTLK